jgi:hypothetical protein
MTRCEACVRPSETDWAPRRGDVSVGGSTARGCDWEERLDDPIAVTNPDELDTVDGE